ncbi:unnamed protein product, partial [Ostreobium quekettii]
MSRRAASPRLAGAAARLLALAVAWIAAGPGALGGRVEPGAPIVTSCAGLQGALEGLAGGNSDLTILVEGSLDCGPGAWNRKISVGGSLRLEARGPGAVIDWGALRGGLVLEDGAVLGLANLVLAQEAMGDEVAVAAVGAAGNKGRAIMEMTFRPGFELEIRMCQTVLGCNVGAGAPEITTPAVFGGNACRGLSDRRPPPQIKPAGVSFAPSALLTCLVSSAVVLGAGVRSRAGWMRQWARSFGAFGCVRCRRCKYDAPDRAASAMARLEPLCIEVPYLNDPTMAAHALDGMELGELQLGSPLGRGGFGRVYKALHNHSVMAVKVIEHDARMLQAGLGEPLEALLSMHLDHPNIVKTYLKQTRGRNSVQASVSTGANWQSCQSGERGRGRARSAGSAGGSGGEEVEGELEDMDEFSYIEQNLRASATFAEEADERFRTWIVMEYCDRGSLNMAIRDGIFFHDEGKRREPKFVSMLLTALDIANALAYLHAQKVVHGDLKAHNVLLKSTSADERGFYCKVGDFGLSRMMLNNKTQIETFTCGTVRYMPPELLRDGVMTPAVDVYSYGMLLWEMVSGSKAFSGMHRNEVMVATVEGRRPAIPSHCPTKFASLIQECWQQDNARRPTFKKILSQLRRLASTYSSSAAHSLMGTAIKEERQSVELRHSLEIAASKKLSIEAGKARVVKAHAMPAQCLDSSGVSSGDRPPLPAPPLPAPPATVRSPPKSNPLWTGLPRKTEVIGNPLWGARRSLGSRPSQDPGRFPLWAFGSPAPVTDLPDVGSPKGPREEEGSRVMAMKRLPLRVPQRVSADCHEPALTSRSDSASEFASPHFRRDADKPPARGGDEPASGTLDPSSRSSSVTVPMVSACGPGTAMPWRSVTPNYTQHNVGLGNFRPRTSLDNVGMLQPRASVEGRPSADLLPVLGAGKTPMVNPQVSLWLTTSQGSNLGLGSVAACQSPAAALAPAAAQPQLPASPVATPPSPTAPSSPVPPSTPTPTRKRGGRACAAVGAGTVIPRLAISKIMGSPSEQLIKSPECRPQEWDLQCADGADVKVDKHHPKPSWWNSIDTTGSWSFRSAHSEGASRSTSDERKRSGESMLITPGSTPVQPAAEDTSFPRVSAAGSSVKSRVSVGAGRERRYSSRLFTTDPGLGAA